MAASHMYVPVHILALSEAFSFQHLHVKQLNLAAPHIQVNAHAKFDFRELKCSDRTNLLKDNNYFHHIKQTFLKFFPFETTE